MPIVYSLKPDRSNPLPLEGAVIPVGVPVYVFVPEGPGVSRVEFNNVGYSHIENFAPWDYAGTGAGGAAVAARFDQSGRQIVKATIRRGALVELSAAGFTVGTLTPPPPPVPRIIAGISPGYEVTGLGVAALDSAMAGYAAMGATWVRIDVPWSGIENPRGTFKWAGTDRVVAAANAHGLKVLGVFAYTPGWAKQGGSDHVPPADVSDYARAAGVAAARYAGKVHAWELWNEPNLGQFWSPNADPARYRLLMLLAAAAVRNADPGALIITAGLAPATTSGPNMEPVEFLNRIGVLPAQVDAIGWHPYYWVTGTYVPPSEPSGWNTAYKAKGITTGRTPLWFTEAGAPVAKVGAATQARTVTDLFAWARTIGAGAVFIYTGQDGAAPYTLSPQAVDAFHAAATA